VHQQRAARRAAPRGVPSPDRGRLGSETFVVTRSLSLGAGIPAPSPLFIQPRRRLILGTSRSPGPRGHARKGA
jgi:hypothetical protein